MVKIVDDMPVVFMEKWFPLLPLELQRLIMAKTYRMPAPKFRKGNVVQFCPEDKARMFAYRATHGPMPTGRLIIWAAPVWSWKHGEWSYDYEYGWDGTHEGTALESSLVSVYRYVY